MTKMTDEERNELIAAMRNHTELARLNSETIVACFDKLVELGYDIVKRPASGDELEYESGPFHTHKPKGR